MLLKGGSKQRQKIKTVCVPPIEYLAPVNFTRAYACLLRVPCFRLCAAILNVPGCARTGSAACASFRTAAFKAYQNIKIIFSFSDPQTHFCCTHKLDTPFKQQLLRAWQPILTPTHVIITFLIIGLVFLPVGITLLKQSSDVVENEFVYDGNGGPCQITKNNAGTICNVDIVIDKDMKAPVYLYYQLTNFYQNHRKYVKSLSFAQLRGEQVSSSDLHESCKPLDKVKDGSGNTLLLNPCGLVANSFFNDVIRLNSTQSNPTGLTLDKSNIAWTSDVKDKFKQPDGFKYEQCQCAGGILPGGLTDCSALCGGSYQCGTTGQPYVEGNKCYAYQYPNDATTQYLYESYPGIISPILGVLTEDFIVWMRTAGLPKFRKLYGKINKDLKKGDTVTFTIVNNFNVESFQGTKAIILTTVSWFGGKNPFLGRSYISIGAICIILAGAFTAKHMISPRKLGDTKYLVWKDA